VVDARPACLPARAASPHGPGGTKEARRAGANSYEPEWRRSAAAAIGARNGSAAQSPPSKSPCVWNRKARRDKASSCCSSTKKYSKGNIVRLQGFCPLGCCKFLF